MWSDAEPIPSGNRLNQKCQLITNSHLENSSSLHTFNFESCIIIVRYKYIIHVNYNQKYIFKQILNQFFYLYFTTKYLVFLAISKFGILSSYTPVSSISYIFESMNLCKSFIYRECSHVTCHKFLSCFNISSEISRPAIISFHHFFNNHHKSSKNFLRKLGSIWWNTHRHNM